MWATIFSFICLHSDKFKTNNYTLNVIISPGFYTPDSVPWVFLHGETSELYQQCRKPGMEKKMDKGVYFECLFLLEI